MSVLGFQVVLLDEDGKEVQRIPDVYYEDESICVDDRDYGLIGATLEGGQRIRYFQRVPEGTALPVDHRQAVVAHVASKPDMLKMVPNGVWLSGEPQTLFGYPIIYSDKVPVGEIRFGPLTKEWAREYFEAMFADRLKATAKE